MQVTKVLFVKSSIMYNFDAAESWLESFESCSYVTGVTTTTVKSLI